MLFCSLAFCDVDVDADDALWVPGAVIGYDAARFDPSNFTIRANNPVIHIVDVPPIVKSSGAILIQSPEVVRVHPGTPLCARRFFDSLGQTVYGRVTLGNGHSLQIGIIRMGANKSCPSGERKLRVAFAKSLLALAQRS